MNLDSIDWYIILGYLILLILLSAYLSKDQKSSKDYFVASRKQKSKSLAISILATQCSTNSILGAPAFVAFSVMFCTFNSFKKIGQIVHIFALIIILRIFIYNHHTTIQFINHAFSCIRLHMFPFLAFLTCSSATQTPVILTGKYTNTYTWTFGTFHELRFQIHSNKKIC